LNKEEYQKLRKEGKRGQGPQPQTTKYISELSKAFSRRRAQRKKYVDPIFTKAYTKRPKKNTKEQVLRTEEIRHLFSLVRKGLFR